MKNVKLYLLPFSFLIFSSLMAQDNVFRIAHLNMGQLSMGKNNHTTIMKNERKQRIEDFKRVFDCINADVIGVCEYAPFFSLIPDSTEDQQDLTHKAIFNDYRYFERSRRSSKDCNGIFSRNLPLKNKSHVLYSKRKGRRGYIVTDIDIGGKTVKLVETHLDVSRYKEQRSVQIKELIEAFENENYVIICGDFNVQKTADYDVFKDAGFDMANHGTFGNLITCPTIKGGRALDNILVKGFVILDVLVYNTRLSDHYAIACDLQIKK